MLEFQASQVQVFKDDDSEVIVGLYDQTDAGKLHYLELSLAVYQVRGVCDFRIKAEVGRPERVGNDCIISAELKRDSLHVVFTAKGSVAKIGEVKITFDLNTKSYQQLKRGLQEVFCAVDLLKIVAVKRE